MTDDQLVSLVDERRHDAETRLLRASGDYQLKRPRAFVTLRTDLGNVNISTGERLAGVETSPKSTNGRSRSTSSSG